MFVETVRVEVENPNAARATVDGDSEAVGPLGEMRPLSERLPLYPFRLDTVIEAVFDAPG